MPKVIVCGRGGCGKSTLVSLLAMELARNHRVLVLDADESNLGLGAMLGLQPPSQTIMEGLGGKPAVFDRMKVMFESDFKERPRFFEGDFSLSDLPPEGVTGNGLILFARIGKIEHSMEGCACPMGAVAKGFLAHLRVGRDEWVLVDTEAGVEHFGRGLLEGADFVLVVADPSFEAAILAEKASRLAREAGKPFAVVLNKVDKETQPPLRDMLAKRALEALGTLPYSSLVAKANLAGDPLSSEPLRDMLYRILAGMERRWGNESST